MRPPKEEKLSVGDERPIPSPELLENYKANLTREAQKLASALRSKEGFVEVRTETITDIIESRLGVVYLINLNAATITAEVLLSIENDTEIKAKNSVLRRMYMDLWEVVDAMHKIAAGVPAHREDRIKDHVASTDFVKEWKVILAAEEALRIPEPVKAAELLIEKLPEPHNERFKNFLPDDSKLRQLRRQVKLDDVAPEKAGAPSEEQKAKDTIAEKNGKGTDPAYR